MSKTWFLTPSAQAALVDIYHYTMTKWGEEQAERYTSGLFDKFEAILHHVVLWRPIAPEYNVSGYVTRYEKHLIYWRQFSDGQIGIAAILHESMLKTDRLAAGFEEF